MGKNIGPGFRKFSTPVEVNQRLMNIGEEILQAAEDSVRIAREIINDPEVPANVRLYGAIHFMDRVLGKPTARLETESHSEHVVYNMGGEEAMEKQEQLYSNMRLLNVKEHESVEEMGFIEDVGEICSE